MKLIFFLNHPAHFHLFKETIRILKRKNHQIVILIKKKDVLQDLLNEENWKYHNVYPKDRKNSRVSMILSLAKRELELSNIVKKEKPSLMIGTSVEITHIGKIFNIPSIVVNEDDIKEIPLWANICYPFATTILAPNACDTGRWKFKTVFYNGYHELAYLHPKYFKPNHENIPFNQKPFYILRFAELKAHHDKGKTGIDDKFAWEIISRLEKKGKILISSERKLASQLEKFRIKKPPSVMHDLLAFASLYIGDSQTMAAEAAVLGTPSIRFNDFIGKLGYLNELEEKYNLTIGIPTGQKKKLLETIEHLLAKNNLKKEWGSLAEKMIKDKIDVTEFMVWFIENYPNSFEIMRKDPDYQYNFK